MSPWRRRPTLEAIAAMSPRTMVEHLDIRFTDVGEDSITATMPVDARTHTPFRHLHGGASVALSETLGSVAANFCTDEDHYAVGVEINANHVRSVGDTGPRRPQHPGLGDPDLGCRRPARVRIPPDGRGHAPEARRLTRGAWRIEAMSLRLPALVLVLALAAGACGMRGPLYLPEAEPAAVPESPAQPADEATEEDEQDDEEAGR